MYDFFLTSDGFGPIQPNLLTKGQFIALFLFQPNLGSYIGKKVQDTPTDLWGHRYGRGKSIITIYFPARG